jgi:hypothetical protein
MEKNSIGQKKQHNIRRQWHQKMPVTIFTKNGDNTIKKNMTKKTKK